MKIKKNLALFLAFIMVFGASPVGALEQLDFSLPEWLKSPFSLNANAAEKVWDGSVATGFASGSGTQADPYIINTAAQLAFLATSVNKGTTYSGKYIKLGSNIILNSADMFAKDENGVITGAATGKTPVTWVPIGKYINSFNNKKFECTFDGDFHTVSGLFINTSQTYAGLFGQTNDDAQIKNVGVINAFICGSSYVGGVCGENYGTIEGCYNTGSMNGSASVGGVCGENYGAIGSSYNTGSISANTNVGSMNGSASAGGVCGENYGTIGSCYNTGSVSANTNVGGMCGRNYGTIGNCYNTGSVSGNSNAGGVAGGSGATVSSCYYLTGTASYGIGSSSSNVGAAPLSDAQMKIQSSFDGWDFTTLWTMDGSPYYSYPELTGMDYAGEVLNRIAVKDMPTKTVYCVGDTLDMTGLTLTATYNNDATQTITSGFTCSPTQFSTIGTQTITVTYEGKTCTYDVTVAASGTWGGVTGTGFASGTGTESDPYIIETNVQLAFLAAFVSSGTSYSEQFIKLANDLTLNSADMFARDKSGVITGAAILKKPERWTPIGIYANEFCGTFDGDGHTVGGIYINTTSNYQGLFGSVFGGTIKNLGVIDSYISGKEGVGGIVGYNDGTVSGCYNTGSVNGTGNFVGGVAGRNNFGTVSSCYNTGSVGGTGNHVGGVAGYNYDGTIINSYNTGSVSGKYFIGGAVGSNAGHLVSNCYNTGSVSGSSPIGGVFGSDDGTIENCYYLTGTASYGIGFSSSDVGAAPLTDVQMKTRRNFVGWDFHNVWAIDNQNGYEYPQFMSYLPFGGKDAAIWDGTIASSFASGAGTESDPYIINTSEQLAFLAASVNDGTTYSGKFIKLNSDIILNFADAFERDENGVITGIVAGETPKSWTAIGEFFAAYDSQPFSGTFDGNGHTVRGLYINTTGDNQGLFGCVENSTVKNIGVIDSYISGNNNVGGVFGYNRRSMISNCYSTGNVIGNSNVGGVIGKNYYWTVSNCYSAGSVSGSSNVGGVVGYIVYGTIRNCYYLAGTASYGIGSTSSDVGAEPLTDAQMKEQSSFVDWDFTTVWTMDGDPDYPYPEPIGEILIGITVKDMPTKTEYSVGDTLDTTGLTLNTIYNNGTIQPISSGFTCTPTQLNEPGMQSIAVCYDGFSTSFSVTVDGLVVTSETNTVNVGSTLRLNAQYFVGSIEAHGVTWVSSNTAIATVDADGLVTAKRHGNIKITATDENGNTAEYYILVLPTTAAVSIYSNSGSLSQKLNWWKSYSTATMSLGYQIFNCDEAVRYVWTSSSSRVKIDQQGNITNTGAFSRLATITLTAYDADGNVIAKSSVKVSFYKFSWQRDRLQSQAIVSDNIFSQSLSEQELEKSGEDTDNTGFEFVVSFISFVFDMFRKAVFTM